MPKRRRPRPGNESRPSELPASIERPSAVTKPETNQRVIVLGAGADVAYHLPTIANLARELAVFSHGDGAPVHQVLRRKLPNLGFTFDKYAGDQSNVFLSELFTSATDVVPTLTSAVDKLGYVQWRRTSARCQRRIVSGETRKAAQRSRGPAEPGACHPTSEHDQLLTEHQDLGVLGAGIQMVDAKELEDSSEQAVEEAERHGVAGSPLRSILVKPVTDFLDPSGNVVDRFLSDVATAGTGSHRRPTQHDRVLVPYSIENPPCGG